MRTIIITLMAMTLFLSACSGQDTSDLEVSDGATGAPAMNDMGDVGGESVDAEAPRDEQLLAYQRDVLENRKIIQQATLELTDDDTEGLFSRITMLVERSGGFVASAELTRSDDEGRGPFINLTIRIPADEMTSTLSSIEDLADEVTAKTIGSQDVTEEYSDIEAQLRNLTAYEDELLVILTEVRESSTSKADELLSVFERIRQVRDEIERLEGRQRLLDDLISLATIDVSLFPEYEGAPIVDEGWQPGDVVRDALRATVDAFQSIVDGLIWVALGILPILLAIGIPLFGIVWFWRKRSRARRPNIKTEAQQ
ncbi:MAG: DUF4349 domain-containing protein [Acidimicrobiia bacterium]|nr:DUF4349 domain-containing protein [Acidimicrobiia bacterium]